MGWGPSRRALSREAWAVSLLSSFIHPTECWLWGTGSSGHYLNEDNVFFWFWTYTWYITVLVRRTLPHSCLRPHLHPYSMDNSLPFSSCYGSWIYWMLHAGWWQPGEWTLDLDGIGNCVVHHSDSGLGIEPRFWWKYGHYCETETNQGSSIHHYWEQCRGY